MKNSIPNKDRIFFTVLFIIFICIIAGMYSGYKYYPAPKPNEYIPQTQQAPAESQHK